MQRIVLTGRAADPAGVQRLAGGAVGRWLRNAGIVVGGALLSMAATGFVFGLDNNLFQLPILGRLYDLPQFASDPFQQSLRYYASGVWRLLEGSDRWIAPAHTLLALGLLARILAFAGFLACAHTLGVRTTLQKALFAALLASADLMLGYSFAGSQGLFLNHATHSEIANGLLLLSWAAAARARLTTALALAGATFFCNAFMGMWGLAVLGAMTLWLVGGGVVRPVEAAKRLALGAPIFAILAAPVALAILSNPDFGRPFPIDYRDYLTGYWPKHFLIASVPGAEIVGLCLVVSLAILALTALGRRAAPFGIVLAALLCLYLAGVVAPSLTGSPAILNLHLLRTSGPIQMVAALAALALAVRWATGRDAWRARALAPGLILSLCAMQAGALIALLVLLLDLVRGRVREALARALAPRAVAVGVAMGCGALTVGSFAWRAAEERERNATLEALVADWRTVGRWAGETTPVEASFLVPVIDLSRQSVGLSYDRELAPVAGTGADFEYVSRRRVFIDFKRGGAAPWTPSYYAGWRSRIDEVLALRTLEERRAYAARVGAAFVIDLCRAEPATFRAGSLCVYGAKS